MQLVFMKPLIEKVATREGGDNAPELRIPPGLTVHRGPFIAQPCALECVMKNSLGFFEPYYRRDRSRSGDTGESGLGLAIVYAAVEACGGQTVVSLPPAGGFVVTIRLRRNLIEEA
jgi:hypothetical protein